MIQGQINSMIAQIGGMAHLGKTLRNEKGIKNVAGKAIDNEEKVKKVNDLLFGKPSDIDDLPVADPEDEEMIPEEFRQAQLREYAEEYDKEIAEQEYLEGRQKDYDKDLARQALKATASNLQARIDINRGIRKPSTVRTPWGMGRAPWDKNNGNGGNNNGK